MAKQLMIYENVIALTPEQHADVSVETGAHYEFTAKINAVPLMAVEFPMAAKEYTIVFSGSDDNIVPLALIGLRTDENLYLSPEGRWTARYKPAFVRQYPFIFSPTPDSQKFVLCIDEAFAGVNRNGRGERLFTPEKKPTPYTESMLKFLQEFQLQFRRTRAFCKKLQEHSLLGAMQAQVEMGSGTKLSLGGFMAVDRKKLKALSPEILASLLQGDELELMFLHLQSMRNFGELQERLEGLQKPKP